VLEQETGIKAPTRPLPLPLMYAVAGVQELFARTTGKPALLSWAAVKSLKREAGRTRFNHAKSEAELGLAFRPVAETVRDTVAWLRAHELQSA